MRHIALLGLALGVGALALPAAAAVENPLQQERPTAGSSLMPGQALAGQIGPGERQEHSLRLDAGQYVRVVLKTSTAGIGVQLLAPDGHPLAEGGGSRSEREKVLSAVTGIPGDYRLAVTALPTAPAGPYELRLAEARPADPADAQRVEAQHALAAALARRDRGDEVAAVLADLAAVLARYRKAGDVAGEVDTLNKIGDLQLSDGKRCAEALDTFTAARTHAREGGYSWGEALALHNLGVAVTCQPSRTVEAPELYRQSLEQWKSIGDRDQEGATLYDLGYHLYGYGQQDDLGGATTSFERALEIHTETGWTIYQARELAGLGLVAQKREETARAFEFFRRALELSRKSGDRDTEVALLGDLAPIYRARGELQAALQSFDAALTRSEGSPKLRAWLLHNMASFYVELGDLDKAEESYQQVFKLVPETEPTAVYALINLGAILQRRGQTAAALKLYQRARELTGNRKDLEALSHRSIGRAQMALAQPAAALSSLEQSLTLWRQAISPIEEGKTLLTMAEPLAQLGRREQAEERVAEALELARRVENPALQASCLLARAKLARSGGQLSAARAAIADALTVIESGRQAVTDDGLRASFFATKRSYYQLNIDLLMQLDEAEPGRGYAAEALAASEQARSRGLLDLLAEGKIDLASGVEPDLKRQETMLADDLAATQSRLAARPDEAERERLRQRLLDKERQLEALAGTIRERNPRYAQIRYPKPLDVAGIHAGLEQGTTLFEYWLGEERSYLFAVTRERMKVYPLPAAGELGEKVENLRRCLEKGPDRASFGCYVDLASKLYDLLIAPARELLPSQGTLLIAPDGALHALPFEVLLAGGIGRNRGLPASRLNYLLRESAIAYVPSATALAELRSPGVRVPAPSTHRKVFLAYADPAFRNSKPPAGVAPVADLRSVSPAAASQLARLPGTEREAKGIAGLYPAEEVALYLGADASKAQVIDNPLLGLARLVHFATHGSIDESQPQLSGLALSPTGPDDDGILRVFEIFNLRLSADLVVLSACETGLGKQVTGEGMMGLTRAFFYAGTPSLVVSLWKASDQSTPGLMIEFYSHLGQASKKAEALRQAKLALIAEGHYAHPFHWAPFILLGDPR